MVEYAILLAGTSLGTFASTVSAFMAGLDWNVLSYMLLGLVALRIAFWAFRSQS
jgi:uncharacterized ion transporter superfamily protein YfcC